MLPDGSFPLGQLEDICVALGSLLKPNRWYPSSVPGNPWMEFAHEIGRRAHSMMLLGVSMAVLEAGIEKKSFWPEVHTEYLNSNEIQILKLLHDLANTDKPFWDYDKRLVMKDIPEEERLSVVIDVINDLHTKCGEAVASLKGDVTNK